MKSAFIAAVVSAVVAAASGTAATIVVTSKNIKNGTIQTVDLSAKAKLALKGRRGAPGPAGARGAAGPQGAQGPQGIQGPAGIQRIRLIVSPAVTIAAGAQGRADAVCPAGETAVSGGFGLVGPDAGVFQSVGNGAGWVAQAENAALVPDATLVAYAYCSPGVSFVP
jgi:hypothetical protein